MSEMHTPSLTPLAKLALLLIVLLLLAGPIMYGMSADAWTRLWRNLVERPGGPMSFRYILQPTMAIIAAIHDGLADARSGRSLVFWSRGHEPHERIERLEEALVSTARIILLGLAMDAIYQVTVLKTFYPAEAVIVALTLAFLPYVVLRGPVAFLARRWRSPTQPGQSGPNRSK